MRRHGQMEQPEQGDAASSALRSHDVLPFAPLQPSHVREPCRQPDGGVAEHGKQVLYSPVCEACWAALRVTGRR